MHQPHLTWDRCWYDAGQPHVHCIQHPEGIQGNGCLGFEPDPDIEAFQAMTGVEDPGYDDVDRIEQPKERWSDERRLEEAQILDRQMSLSSRQPICDSRKSLGKSLNPLLNADWV